MSNKLLDAARKAPSPLTVWPDAQLHEAVSILETKGYDLLNACRWLVEQKAIAAGDLKSTYARLWRGRKKFKSLQCLSAAGK
jgi:hypothetical protein